MRTVYWSAGETAYKTLLAIKEAEKTNSILVDFKEFFPSIHKYFGIDYVPKTELLEFIKRGKTDIELFLSVRKKVRLFTGFNIEDSLKFNTEDMMKIIEMLGPDAVFDTNGGIFFSSTYAALKNADKIYVVMEPFELSYYTTSEYIRFLIQQWDIPADIMIGVVIGKGDVDAAAAVTGLKRVIRERI
ncbi:septum site-determining protein MinD [Thermoanaerobacter thermohydrosulfuricus]|uniref:Septum site-determining protein MinD n=1 Tax=Thermoanaerobacter thermohydrosulfuricus TaxID=1516 RepID=A0A1G7ITM3_THETY|nr:MULTISPECIES: hypothetical protein [Thermoanaerobacter]UZQ81858.1 hypothetical protein OEI98_001597 [Thermoanaerobacter sp. RKWS2]SDF15659.1 septum site-determining protein MinD [Thermoanaerobacter thermohydrosulfuricus]